MSKTIYLSKPGIICSAGTGIDAVWAKSVSGERAITRITTAPGQQFYAAMIPESELHATGDRFDMRSLQIEQAALEQIQDEVRMVIDRYGKDQIAVCVGSCDNGSQLSTPAHRANIENGAFPPDYDLLVQTAGYPAAFAARFFGLDSQPQSARAPVLGFATACASSASAIIKAAQLIKSGICKAAIAGGMDMVSDTVVLGFHSLEAVSPEKTNPFSKNRSGITLGDGAAFFVLSAEPLFAPSEAESVVLLGYGESSDAEHMTAPKADGSGAFQAMTEALARANLTPSDIDYVNAHGTGTHLNDSMESRGIAAVFGERASTVPVSSTKAIMGHTLGAAGAVEAALCYKAVKDGVRSLPVHVWDGERDDELPALHFVKKGEQTEKPVRICMSNSFAFGGCNACLIIGKRP
ncbi:MAG: 3-oxoacyl-ACP synthase [Treponema sp.]|nr:3-oxoacyl-ACP synthase [Treponema sp.]